MANPNPLPIAREHLGKAPGGSLPQVFQDPGARGKRLVEKHGMEQILIWYDMLKVKEERKGVPLSTQDCLLIGRIARAQFDGVELERLHDRTHGKVPDRNINLNINADVDPEKLSEQAAEMLARLQD